MNNYEEKNNSKTPSISINSDGKSTDKFSMNQLTYRANGILLWKSVPRNCKLIVEDLLGKRAVVIKDTGIRLVWPFQKATVVNLSTFSIEYAVNEHEGAVTKDGIDVHGMVRINYQVHSKNKSITRFYDQKFADEQIENESKAIIKEFISKYKWDQLKGKKVRGIHEQEELYQSALNLAENYGIMMKSIDPTKLQAPPEIAQMEEKRRAAANEYEIKIGQAKADFEITQIQNKAKDAEGLTEARIEDLKGTIKAKNANKLIEALYSQGFNAQQAYEFLKRTATNQSSILIEGNGNSIDPQTILMAMNKLQNMALTNTNQQNNNSETNSMSFK